jgi:hypothetical protein
MTIPFMTLDKSVNKFDNISAIVIAPSNLFASISFDNITAIFTL